jgi:hypothetical protein
MSGEIYGPEDRISDKAIGNRLLELGVPEAMLDVTVERIEPKNRPNFFEQNPTVDELLAAIEDLPHQYDI